MIADNLQAISPLDGRYQSKTSQLSKYFSESALITYRIKIELAYLKLLSKYQVIRPLTSSEQSLLDTLSQPNITYCRQVKKLEEETHHDVKAVEYFLQKKLQKSSLSDIISFLHFGITSDDVNNLAYRSMTKDSLKQVLIPQLLQVLENLNTLALRYVQIPMLARTHGQPAIPTTFGKELILFALRLQPLLTKLTRFKFVGKLNGAIGAYHALAFTYPKINWPQFSQDFCKELDFDCNELTSQINFPDDFLELFSLFERINGVLLDLNQDLWRYISDDWLMQKGKEKYVGSSTMPQKVNPIEFENSEGNLVLANGFFETFIRKLPISRLQRDLSESTVWRNVGSAFSYCLLAYQSLQKGLDSISVNESIMQQALNQNWNILAEAWQTLARTTGDSKAYERVAGIAKQKKITAKDWQQLTKDCDPKLAKLKPETYLGLSVLLTRKKSKQVSIFINNMKKRGNYV
ncbi:adenylosuccinate lyase [Candidatus Beckwithbacteria bacterium]|nr:adenylosuccinate lyase [Candidatus Beckwithbacteria bacterium]